MICQKSKRAGDKQLGSRQLPGKLNKAKDAIYRANAPVGAIGGTNTGAYKPIPATKVGTPPMRTTKPSASMIKKMGFKK